MSTPTPSPWSRLALNSALVVFGLCTLLLLYALGTRVFSPAADPAREANPADLIGEIMQVEVRNGCGVDGLAQRATQHLRDAGFDVVDIGNHSSLVSTSQVIDRVGDLDAARKLAAALGIAPEHVRQEIDTGYFLDASVIIGQDYRTLTPFEELGDEPLNDL